ncbi:hypothetical protein NC653_004568 [Populus alba x Populus x berolinensis]|uniref:Uncharacterized protein n=2 Tax=Populus TaxID=3689 RepID=A0AAD6RX33_9ROSI|nr:hypothetical protein NC653_004568 [Populus alba x Populus x berolinensis]
MTGLSRINKGETPCIDCSRFPCLPLFVLSVVVAYNCKDSGGLLPPGTQFDLFRGTAAMKQDVDDMYPATLSHTTKVWDYASGNLKKDLHYQADETFMMHDDPVLFVDFSRDSEMLASGAKDGRIKVWCIRTGQCLRCIQCAHSQGITSLAFSCDGSQLLSASFDNTASDGTRAVTDSSDCTVKVWDMKSIDCIHTFRTPPPLRGGDASVNSVNLFPKNTDHIAVFNMTSSVCIMTLQGQVVKSFSSGKREGGDFAAACVSPKGEWIYCVGEDRNIYCFSVQSGKLEHLMKVHEKDVIGVTHQNLLATYSEDCTM